MLIKQHLPLLCGLGVRLVLFRREELIDLKLPLEARRLSDVVKQALEEVDQSLRVQVQDCHEELEELVTVRNYRS